MTARKVLVVNADDFGRTPGVNRGIQRAHEQGIVTSATLMVRWPAAEDAGAYARHRRQLAVGLHVDLAEWIYGDDGWEPRYEVVDQDDEQAVAAEIERQLGEFRRLVGGDPTHLDSHQHVHREGPARRLLGELGRRLGIPVRDVTPGITYSGVFYGQDGRGHPVPEAITVDALVACIESLPSGVTELGCHPGEADGHSVYDVERPVEVASLCDARVREALERCEVELRSFAELGDVLPAS